MPLNPPDSTPHDGFESFQALFEFINAQARAQDYSIVKRRPSNYKDGTPRRYDVACVAGGQVYKSVSTGQRRTTTKKTSCPWKGKAVLSSAVGRWFFDLQDGTHNHGPLQFKPKRASRTRKAVVDTHQSVVTDTSLAVINSEMSIVGEAQSSTPTGSGQSKSTTQARLSDQHGEVQRQLRTRVMAACEACRISKTRCDATRPVCAKCTERGRHCVYPDNDPSSIFEHWGNRILTAIDDQGRLLRDLAQGANNDLTHPPDPSTFELHESYDDVEIMSRKDVPWTPITGADKLLCWCVFPQDRPVSTLPTLAHVPKPNPHANETFNTSRARMLELFDIFMAKFEPKCPVVDVDQLGAEISDVVKNGFGSTAASCMVLLVFALASIWGNYPDDERRTVVSIGGRETQTMSVPEHRAKESWIYFTMAQRRMPMAALDDSLLGATCFCLFGSWHQYNFEPIQAWKMFRTASMLWEAYNLKHTNSNIQRSTQEKSLEQRLYWTCMKAECEMRYELPDLPLCTLQESSFPYSLPSFPPYRSSQQGSNANGDSPPSDTSDVEPTPLSYYYFLAKISLRRLLNRVRHAASRLSPDIDSSAARRLADTFLQLEQQLQQWLECLPPSLRFSPPPDSLPPKDETELVKLMRERYVEIRELLCRAFLYICLHGGSRLTPGQARTYGNKASEGLRLSVYRIETEKPFFRHAGSWVACRVRFNQALCLLAAVRSKELGTDSAAFVRVPRNWWDCVRAVQDRLETWSDQGGGTAELAVLLNWLTER